MLQTGINPAFIWTHRSQAYEMYGFNFTVNLCTFYVKLWCPLVWACFQTFSRVSGFVLWTPWCGLRCDDRSQSRYPLIVRPCDCLSSWRLVCQIVTFGVMVELAGSRRVSSPRRVQYALNPNLGVERPEVFGCLIFLIVRLVELF